MKLLSNLPRNSKYPLMLEPLWAVFGGMIFFYAPLYMKEIGLTGMEMGFLNTVNLFVGFVCHSLAAPIINRLGRKRTTLIFDLISWTIPMLIWAFARNFWYFLAAAVINAFVRVVFVSWYCLITEDAEDSKRAKIFGIIYVINFATGMFTPVTGLIISRYGTILTMRILYILGAVSMTSMFLIRNSLTTETRAGMELMSRHIGLSPFQSIKSYISTIAGVYKNKNIILIALIYIITNFIFSMNFFQILFLKEHLGFNEREVSLSPGISALVSILVYVFVIPRLRKHFEVKTLAGGLVLCAAGSLMFLLIPRNNLLILLITATTLAVGNFISQTYRDSVLMNRLGEHEKADIFSAVQTLTTLVCIPSGYIAGYFYSLNPVLPFITVFVLFMITILISQLLLTSTRKDHTANSTC